MGAGMSWLVPADDGCVMLVKVTPRSSRPGIEGVVAGRLVVRLRSAPADGKANAELVSLLARTLGIPKNAVEIRSGVASRLKRILVRGRNPEAVSATILHA
jgi:uncharacterized protein